MKRLLALLLLVVSPAFAQQYTPGPYLQPPTTGETENLIYTTLNTPPDGAQYTWTGFVNTASQGGGTSGGNVPGYNSSTGTFLFGYTLGTVTYRLTNSSEFPNPGTEIDSFKYSWEYFNQDFSRGSLTANIKFYDPNNSLLENYNFQLGQTTSGWTLFSGQIDFASAYNMSDLAKIEISFTGKDDRFWAGYYGPQVRDLDLSLVYTSAPPPTDFPYWDRLAGENEFFTLTEPGVVRYGANGVYIYAEFQPGTYACTNSDWGNDPIGGVVKSCDFGSNIPPPVAVVDCAVDPYDATCIIDSVTPDETYVASEETGSDDGSDDGSDYLEQQSADEEEEELLADADVISEELSVEELIADEDLSDEDLEELLAEEVYDEDEEEVVTKELVASSPIKEMVNEEKAATLSDSISKDVLESALSVAAAAETSGASGGTSSESSSSSSSSRSSNVSGGGSEMVVASAESTSSTTTIDSSGQESSAAGDASMELLETGRVLGQEALSVTMAATEASATDSLSQAESIAQTSSSDSMTASSTTAETINSIEIENVIETVAATESNNDTSVEMVGMTENTSETGNVSDGSDVFASIENNPSAASAQEAEDVALAVVNNSIASSEQKTFEDETNTDAEVTNAMVDPALAMANTFNQAPSMMNLEILGIVKPIEEKSDAERSAEKVVAANKEQQDEINKNYMDADQSGIVAAIAVDADVSSYLSARLMDNNTWYKPEDIYKGVVIKDNARGSYFLEKGNTDTYKKMVEEQYK
jgi:hypothetical protein